MAGGIELVKFADLAKNKGNDYTQPPYRVPSKDLDENFKKVSPAEQEGELKPYSIDFTDEGWTLVPEVVFDVCENGTPRQYKFVCQRAL